MIEELGIAIQPLPKKTRRIHKQYWMINFIFIVLVSVKQMNIYGICSWTYHSIWHKNKEIKSIFIKFISIFCRFCCRSDKKRNENVIFVWE